MENKKTISGGSDGSAGFITGGGGQPGEQLSPNPDNQSDSVQELLGGKKTQDLIQSAMRGAMEAILESVRSAATTGRVERVSLNQLKAATSSPSELGTSMAQVDSNLETVNVVTTPAVPAPKIEPAPIPALLVKNDVPQQTVLENTSVKQVDAEAGTAPVEVESPDAEPVDDMPSEEGVDSPADEVQYESALEPANIPLSVPNYSKPEGPSTKVCATCKYFNKRSATTGDCFAYGFTAIADYTCDSWSVATPTTNGVDSDRIHIIENPIGKPAPVGIAPQYQSIDFYPNKIMADNATLAIQERDQHVGEERGITPYAETCARAIIQNQPLMPEMWRRIYSYYYEHKDDPLNENWEKHGPLWQQWMAWGGEEGFNRAKQVINAMNQADEDAAVDMLVPATPAKSVSAKRLKNMITQGSQPTSVTPGGEVINGNLSPVPGSKEGLENPEGLAEGVAPSLSESHGRGKSIPGAFYLPGERVYSKSAFSLGEIIKSEYIADQYLYNIKLIDASGLVRGTALVHEGDLQPRSLRAIKRMQIKSVRESVESYVKHVITSLEELKNAHKDYTVNPITTEALQSARKEVQNILSNDVFADASSKMGMRKYVRAMQDVEHSLGAAVHIMDSSKDLALSSDSTKDAETITGYGQKNAAFRIDESIERAKECLLEEVPMRAFTIKGDQE